MQYFIFALTLLLTSSLSFAATGAPAATFGSGFEMIAGAALLGSVGLKHLATKFKEEDKRDSE